MAYSVAERKLIVQLGDKARSQKGKGGNAWKFRFQALLKREMGLILTVESARNTYYTCRKWLRKHAAIVRETKHEKLEDEQIRVLRKQIEGPQGFIEGIRWLMRALGVEDGMAVLMNTLDDLLAEQQNTNQLLTQLISIWKT